MTLVANRSKRSPEKDLVILEALRDTPTFTYAAKKARITRGTLQEWRKEDPEFAAACEQARDEGMSALEDALIERGLDTDTTAAIFMLKGWRAQRYRERIEHTGENGAPLTVVIRERSDGPA